MDGSRTSNSDATAGCLPLNTHPVSLSHSSARGQPAPPSGRVAVWNPETDLPVYFGEPGTQPGNHTAMRPPVAPAGPASVGVCVSSLRADRSPSPERGSAFPVPGRLAHPCASSQPLGANARRPKAPRPREPGRRCERLTLGSSHPSPPAPVQSHTQEPMRPRRDRL